MLKRFKSIFAENSIEISLLKSISSQELPQHVAIIMDGNGRWAAKKNLKRIDGHKKGGEVAQKIIEFTARLGIRHLTLFTFSSENWNRPLNEVNFLFKMLYENLEKKRELLDENGIRLFVLGDLEKIPLKLKKRFLKIMDATKKNQKLQLNLAFNYGSRLEIVQAIKRIVNDKVPSEKIDIDLIKNYLYTKGIPDPDLLIRTSGEQRISNFLLFQSAYSEFYFSSVLWPDFDAKEYFTALLDFQHRHRRFGGL